VHIRTRFLLGLVSLTAIALSGCGQVPVPFAAPPPAAAPAPPPAAAPVPPAAAAPPQSFPGQGVDGAFQSGSQVEASLGRRSPENGYWPPVVQVGNSPLGNILYDGSGFPLYISTNDSTRPPESHCVKACTKQFFPVLVNAQITYQNVDPSYIGTTLRADGTQQLTYYSHPVYRSINDLVPGQVTAHGFENSWYAIGSDGSIAGSR
jgi:predicted lipoprotein with Yx(FWY)xxD motif